MIAVVIVAVALVVLCLAWKASWRAPAPNEVLIVHGLGVPAADGVRTLGFKVVASGHTLVLPAIQSCHRFSLAPRTVPLDLGCVTSDGVRLRVRGEMTYRVGDGTTAIATAAQGFLGNEKAMDENVPHVVANRLESIADDLTAEAAAVRTRLAGLLREAAARPMGRLGLVVETLQIQEILSGKSGSDRHS